MTDVTTDAAMLSAMLNTSNIDDTKKEYVDREPVRERYTSSSELSMIAHELEASRKKPTFSGKSNENYEDFYANLKAYIKSLGPMSEERKSRTIKSTIMGEASTFIDDEDIHWSEIDSILRREYGIMTNKVGSIVSMKQGADENVQTFARNLKIAATRCNLTGSTREDMLLEVFMKNCKPSIALKLNIKLPKTLDSAIDYETITSTKELKLHLSNDDSTRWRSLKFRMKKKRAQSRRAQIKTKSPTRTK